VRLLRSKLPPTPIIANQAETPDEADRRWRKIRFVTNAFHLEARVFTST
jgi:hypothetical protein